MPSRLQHSKSTNNAESTKERKQERDLVAALTNVLSHAVRVLDPFREVLDQVAQHGWHVVDGLGVIEEKDLPWVFSIARCKLHIARVHLPYRAVRLLVGLQIGDEAGAEEFRRSSLATVLVRHVP